jgi:hypothetical protein
MHTQSGAATFAACLQLFRFHPLAVAPPGTDGADGSMVLRHRKAGYFVLTREGGDAFVLRSWNSRDGIEEKIRPRESVPDLVCEVIARCLPVPRHGTLLGWITGKQVTALLPVHSAPDPGSSSPAPGPEVRVLPLEETSQEWHWPPFTLDPLDEWRLWEYVDWNELVDVAPLIDEHPGCVLWVPSPDGRRTGHVIVTENLRAEKYWMPAGVYADHWTLREGLPAPSVGELLKRPKVVDLAVDGLWAA